MGQTLTNGIYLPDEGERNSYSGLEANWRTLDALILTVNGKAAPNIANTWTAAQTFTAGITGDLTGNVTGNVTGDLTGIASKAIADKDGTSIKTGYVNVAGNQTVTGQKTWSNNQFFTTNVYHRNSSYEIGNTPASNTAIPIYLADKNNAFTGAVRNTTLTSGRTQTELQARNKFTSGALSPTGTDVITTLQVEVQPDGSKTLYFDGSIRNDVLPNANNTYSLGSSSYQWSSVYAQTYYYSGTQWGLDRNNTWTGNNTFTGTTIALKNNALEWGVAPASSNSNNLAFVDKNGDTLCYLRNRVNADGETYIHLYANNKYKDGQLDPTGTNVASQFYVGITKNGVPYVVPRADTYPDINNAFNLGTSTNKWKTLNGINPGALSLPINANSASFNIDTTNWTTDGSIIVYTPLLDGWIYINVRNDDTNGDSFIIFDDGVSGFGTSVFGNKGLQNNGVGLLCLMMPVNKNNYINIRIKSPGIISARLYPCNGNV